MARSSHASVTPRVDAPAWVVALLLAATGCTICPDPFDYSGPVPNGSAPQNDFRARSGGIAPLDGVPRPWPPVVRAVPDDAPEGPTVVAAAESPDAADTQAGSAVRAVVAGASEEATQSANAADAAATEPSLDDILPPPASPRAEIGPPLRETPGWRPRD